MPDPNCKYLIWSNEHSSWWRPREVGYTAVIGEAGRYGFDRAAEICQKANEHLPATDEPHEVFVLAPECLPPHWT